MPKGMTTRENPAVKFTCGKKVKENSRGVVTEKISLRLAVRITSPSSRYFGTVTSRWSITGCSLQKLKDGLWSGDARNFTGKIRSATDIAYKIHSISGHSEENSQGVLDKGDTISAKPVLCMLSNCLITKLFNVQSARSKRRFSSRRKSWSSMHVFARLSGRWLKNFSSSNSSAFFRFSSPRRWSDMLGKLRLGSSSEKEKTKIVLSSGRTLGEKGEWGGHDTRHSSRLKFPSCFRVVSIGENNLNKKGYHVATIN